MLGEGCCGWKSELSSRGVATIALQASAGVAALASGENCFVAPCGAFHRQAPPAFQASLDVEVENELLRMRAQAHGVQLFLPLVLEPGFDQVLREHVPLKKECVIGLEGVENFL